MNLTRFTIASLIGAVILLAAFALALRIYASWNDEYAFGSPAQCNVSVVRLEGTLYQSAAYDEAGVLLPGASADDIARRIEEAQSYGDEGVILFIDSGGGYMVPAETVMKALQRSSIPAVAVIGENGLSAAYMAATGADRIIASPYSSVGSIGVTFSYLENAGANDADGYTFQELASGPLKDAGNPDAPLSAEGRARFQELADYYGDLFIKLVAQNRNVDPAVVAGVADGFSITSPKALELGLIDELGDMDTALDYLSGATGIAKEDLELCDPL